MADSLNQDMLDILEIREQQLTHLIKVLQKKRRDVRATQVRLKADTLSPVANPFKTRGPQEVSGGNNEVSKSSCRHVGGPYPSCPDECY